VLAKAFRLRTFPEILQSPHVNEPKQKFVSAERRNQHARSVRSPESTATNSQDRPLIGASDHSEINIFQSSSLRRQVKILSHCVASSTPGAPKQPGILRCIEQRSR
jgi:hypothetical protein